MCSRVVGTLLLFLSWMTFIFYTATPRLYIASASAEERVTSPKDDPLCNATCRTIRIVSAQRNVVHIESPGISQGTGTVIMHEGVAYVLTNNHVVEKALSGRAEVTFESGEKAEVEILGRDPAVDLAILSAPALPRGVTPAKLGDGIVIGQQVYALGYPFGERSITFGYINAVETWIWPFAWTQTPLDPGNSGGPLFNEKIEVVGVNTAVINRKVSTSGAISLVIPVDYVKRLIPRLLRERIVRRGAAGIRFMDPMRIPLQFFEKHGIRYSLGLREVVVTDVETRSPAEGANIREGDVILRWNDAPVTSARKLLEKIFFEHSPGDEITVTIRRGEQTFRRVLRLIEYTPPKQAEG